MWPRFCARAPLCHGGQRHAAPLLDPLLVGLCELPAMRTRQQGAGTQWRDARTSSRRLRSSSSSCCWRMRHSSCWAAAGVAPISNLVGHEEQCRAGRYQPARRSASPAAPEPRAAVRSRLLRVCPVVSERQQPTAVSGDAGSGGTRQPTAGVTPDALALLDLEIDLELGEDGGERWVSALGQRLQLPRARFCARTAEAVMLARARTSDCRPLARGRYGHLHDNTASEPSEQQDR
jgi:hypothetical protein